MLKSLLLSLLAMLVCLSAAHSEHNRIYLYKIFYYGEPLNEVKKQQQLIHLGEGFHSSLKETTFATLKGSLLFTFDKNQRLSYCYFSNR